MLPGPWPPLPIPASHQRYNTYLTVKHYPAEACTALQLLGHPKCYGIIEDAPVAPGTPHSLQRQHRTASPQGSRWLQLALTAPTGTAVPVSGAKAAPRTAMQVTRPLSAARCPSLLSSAWVAVHWRPSDSTTRGVESYPPGPCRAYFRTYYCARTSAADPAVAAARSTYMSAQQ